MYIVLAICHSAMIDELLGEFRERGLNILLIEVLEIFLHGPGEQVLGWNAR